MDRRCFLKCIASMSLSGMTPVVRANDGLYHRFHAKNNIPQTSYLSAAKNAAGEFSVQQITAQGEVLASFDLPRRGHSFAVADGQWLIAIGRRPANIFFAFDCHSYQVLSIRALKNRRFYGHGVFNASGQRLYLTENDLDSGQGVIGIYAADQQFKRLGEIPTHGIGPHDIQFDAKREYLIVANGGVKTHPTTGRKKLNVASMDSSLAFIHPQSGQLLQQYRLGFDHRFNSIRHLAVDKNNHVYISLQNQKYDEKQCLLAVFNSHSQTLFPCEIPSDIEPQLNHYLGDISLDHTENYFVTTSPRGNQALLFNVQGEFLDAQTINDVCGIAKTTQANQFLLTSGTGKIYQFSVDPSKPRLQQQTLSQASIQQNIAWDNHLMPVL